MNNVFFIRFWAPAEPASGADPKLLRGVVERIGSGRSVLFVGAQELFDLLLTESAGSLIES